MPVTRKEHPAAGLLSSRAIGGLKFMSAQPDAVVRTWFKEVRNEGREQSIDRIMASDALAHGLPGGTCCGPAAFRPVFQTFRGAFPDIHIEIEQSVSEGDKVAVYCRVTGTHTGDGLPIAPTGKRVDFHGVTIARVVDGTLREGWNCFDFLTMYQQLGVLPANPGA
jgi:predicted ester cyclase